MRSKVFAVGAVLGVLLGLGVGGPAAAYGSSGGEEPAASATIEGSSFGQVVLAEAVTPTGVEVAIDIRPGSECNPVNPKSRGVVPVAILSSETFDATLADPSTVYLEDAPVASVSKHDQFLASEEDVNGDGLVDLVVKIDAELLEVESPTGTAVLVGSTFEGQAFWGEDIYMVVPPDVGNGSWAIEAIAACMRFRIASGYPDGLYYPDLEVTRDQMAAFVARAVAGGDEEVPRAGGGATFSDVGEADWAYHYVEFASDSGIVQGYPDGTYQPAAEVTRGQMAAYLARALSARLGDDLGSYQGPATPTFGDVDSSSWCYRYVEYLAEQHVVGGYGDGAYRPDEVVTRDQMAVYIARTFALPM